MLLAFDSFAQLCFGEASLGAAPPAVTTAWLLRVFHEPWTYGAVLGCLGAFFTWLTLLRRAPIGPAFAASHLDIVSVFALSATFLGEPVSGQKLMGCALIMAGILCLALDPPPKGD